jgi:hypothetical protein
VKGILLGTVHSHILRITQVVMYPLEVLRRRGMVEAEGRGIGFLQAAVQVGIFQIVQ